MKTLLMLLISFNVLANEDLKSSSCFQEFDAYANEKSTQYSESMERFKKARQSGHFLGQLFTEPEKPTDFEIGILRTLEIESDAARYSWSKELKKLYDMVNDDGEEEYSIGDIKTALVAGFVEDEFCGFLKGFGAVKRFVRKYFQEQIDLAKSNQKKSKRTIAADKKN